MKSFWEFILIICFWLFQEEIFQQQQKISEVISRDLFWGKFITSIQGIHYILSRFFNKRSIMIWSTDLINVFSDNIRIHLSTIAHPATERTKRTLLFHDFSEKTEIHFHSCEFNSLDSTLDLIMGNDFQFRKRRKTLYVFGKWHWMWK